MFTSTAVWLFTYNKHTKTYVQDIGPIFPALGSDVDPFISFGSKVALDASGTTLVITAAYYTVPTIGYAGKCLHCLKWRAEEGWRTLYDFSQYFCDQAKGDILVISSDSDIYLFQRNGDNGKHRSLASSNKGLYVYLQTIKSTFVDNLKTNQIALGPSGKRLVIGAPLRNVDIHANDFTGGVYVYTQVSGHMQLPSFLAFGVLQVA